MSKSSSSLDFVREIVIGLSKLCDKLEQLGELGEEADEAADYLYEHLGGCLYWASKLISLLKEAEK